MAAPAAEFAPQAIFFIGSFPVTNTFINTLLVDAGLIGSAMYFKKNLSKIPSRFQNLMEMVLQTFYSLTESVAGKNTQKIFPWFMTFFLFILISNWSGLLPGAHSIGFYRGHGEERHLVPLLRNATSELNVTLALALISLVATHVLSIRTIGIAEYLSRFFSLNPVMLFVGILEIVSEFTKIISLSFRLFGNIYAGEVVLGTISSIFAFLIPVPFLLLEVIVGLVQALVFSMLTMAFMSILMTPHHAEEH